MTLLLKRTHNWSWILLASIKLFPLQTLAPPMQSILSRLRQHTYIKIVVFSDQTILHEPVCQWPVCDCLIAFFSKGFPLNKAIAYVNLRKPLLFNDLELQYHLQNRCVIGGRVSHLCSVQFCCLVQYQQQYSWVVVPTVFSNACCCPGVMYKPSWMVQAPCTLLWFPV